MQEYFYLACYVHFSFYTKQVKICHRNADGSPWLYFLWKEWHYILFQSTDKVPCKVNCPLCMRLSWEFYLYIWVLSYPSLFRKFFVFACPHNCLVFSCFLSLLVCLVLVFVSVLQSAIRSMAHTLIYCHETS